MGWDHTTGNREGVAPAVCLSDLEIAATRAKTWSRTRRLLLLFSVFLVASRLLLVRGFVVPIHITGASMAGALHGQHLRIECDDCRIHYECGLRHRGESGGTTCPNCGYDQNDAPAAVCPGDRVLIDQWYGRWQQPVRWDLVALQSPDRSGVMIVKRLIGLPGEQVSIRYGDLYVNDQLLRKPLEVFHEMAVLVHDDRYQPRHQSKLPGRWLADSTASSWRDVGRGYRFESRTGPDSGAPLFRPLAEWLTYRHWLCSPKTVPPAARGEEVRILDTLGYNQQSPRSQMHEVTDLMVSTRVMIEGTGRFCLRVADGATWYIAELHWPSGRWRLWRDSDRVTAVPSPVTRNAGRLDIEYGLYDRMIVLTVNGRLLFEHRLRPSTGRPVDQPASRLSIGAVGVGAEVSLLRVFRDVYFLAPGPPWRYWCTPCPLDQQQFLLLGDNTVVSTDSRHWLSAGIARSSITGRVIRWPDRVAMSRQ